MLYEGDCDGRTVRRLTLVFSLVLSILFRPWESAVHIQDGSSLSIETLRGVFPW